MNHEEAQDVLMHFGVPGMKWGVRKNRGDRVKISRSERKEMRKYQSKTLDREQKASDKKYKIDKQRESLRKYSADTQLERKLANNLGATTKANRVRTEKAQKLKKSIEKSNAEANRKTTQAMVKKYGKKKVDSFNKSENRRAVAIVATVSALTLASMAAAGSQSDSRTNSLDRQTRNIHNKAQREIDTYRTLKNLRTHR